MAASEHIQGYSCEFLDSVSDDFCCKKCCLTARKLSITSCCGETYCHACIADTQQQGKPCPVCGEIEFSITQHIKFQKKVNEFLVYCSLKERVCGWSGPLKELDSHLDPDQDNCQYVDVICPLNCQQTISKNKVEQHVAQECTKREYVCQYCNFKATHEEVVDIHFPECKYVPLQCPNLCGVTFERDFLEDHMQICRLEEIGCEFSGVGCEERFRREDQEDHIRQNSQKHLTLTASAAKNLLDWSIKDKEEKQLLKQTEEQHEQMLVEQERRLIEQERKSIKQEQMQKQQEQKLMEQEQKSKEQEQKLEEQKQKLEEQEQKLEEQKSMEEEQKLKELEKKLEKQKQKLEEQEQKSEKQEQKLDEHEWKLNIQEQKLKEREEKLDDVEKKLEKQKQRFEKREQKLEEKEQKLEKVVTKLEEQEQKLKEQEQKFEEQEQKLKKHEHKLPELEQKSEEQEQKSKEKEQKLKELEKKLEEQEQKLEVQVQELKEQAQKLKEQEEKLKVHEQESKELKQKINDQELTIGDQKHMLHDLDQSVELLRTLLLHKDGYILMTNFSKLRAKDDYGERCSPAMYIHDGGYKFVIGVIANGLGDGHGKAMHVKFKRVKGEHDDLLKWPVTCKMTIELVNPRGGMNLTHSGRVTWVDKTDFGSGYFGRISINNCLHFVEHSRLDPFLVNDTLIFRVFNITTK